MSSQILNHTLSFKKLMYTFFLILIALNAAAQKKVKTEKPFKPTSKEFVISYTISVKGVKSDGIAETYNGGLKTAFVKNDMVRLRLVSLMRTQSIFYDNKKATSKKVATVVKESGKERASMVLNAKQWKVFNSKTDSSRCEIFKDDTIRILNFLCAKAIITTKDSSKLDVYFLPSAKNKILNAAEPLFAKIPGLVMQYSYSKGDKTITYTATTLKSAPILASTFTIPSKGYLQVKYNPGGATTATGDLNADDNDEGTEEEEMETTTPAPPATKEAQKPPSSL
jgi:hypothetical protein